MKHILVVDDVSANLRCVKMILQDDYKVSCVKSGEEALDFVSKQYPDLLLLDIGMPQMDGYEVLTRLKSSDDTKQIPVILLTADGDLESERKGIKLGAAAYVVKPLQPEFLQDLLFKIIGR